MKKFLIFLAIILLFAVMLVGFQEFMKTVTLAVAVAFVMRLLDEIADE